MNTYLGVYIIPFSCQTLKAPQILLMNILVLVD